MNTMTKNYPETVIVSANFELQKLRDELCLFLNTENKRMSIDLSNIETLDSSAIGALISIQHALEKGNGSLKVIGVSHDILRMFKLMRLDKHFEISGM